MPHALLFLVLLLIGIGNMACGTPPTPAEVEDPPQDTQTVIPRGNRQLGISISDRTDGDFNTAFLQAVDIGMTVTGLSLSWDDLEPAPGVYAPNPDFLQIANDFYGSRNTGLLLGINPIDTNNRRLPAHLEDLAWDDPAVVEAFKSLLDWALPKTDEVSLLALSIGNEIDASLGSEDEWASYTRFFDLVAAHARMLRPGLRVGTKITVGGLTDFWAPQAVALNQLTDVVLATYYPLGSDFTILAPHTVEDVFDDVTTLYANRSIMFAEIGSPSTTECGSSEALQAEFIRRTFTSWDAHADQIELLEFVWMHDISQAALDQFEAYYGLSNACFLEYLGTLGLKHPGGADKPAWAALAEEAGLRGW